MTGLSSKEFQEIYYFRLIKSKASRCKDFSSFKNRLANQDEKVRCRNKLFSAYTPLNRGIK